MGLAVHARHPERAVLPEKPQWRDAREAGCLECRQARRHVEREQCGGFLRGHRAPERTSVVPSAEPLIHITNDTSVGGHSGALAQARALGPGLTFAFERLAEDQESLLDLIPRRDAPPEREEREDARGRPSLRGRVERGG